MARSISSRAFVMLCTLLSTYGFLRAQGEQGPPSEGHGKDVSVQPGTADGRADSDGQVFSVDDVDKLLEERGEGFLSRPHRIDLAPARWIWLPSQRTLPNTFVLFRRELELETVPVRASGWITADSRYRLTVNGRRVQRQVFVNNLPWLQEEKETRLCDRSLATAILFDQCPGNRTQENSGHRVCDTGEGQDNGRARLVCQPPDECKAHQ